MNKLNFEKNVLKLTWFKIKWVEIRTWNIVKRIPIVLTHAVLLARKLRL